MFDHATLSAKGFDGFVRLDRSALSEVPAGPGVYAVLVPPGTRPAFTSQSRGGWFKGKDPSVSDERLQAEWVDDAEIIYIGRSRSLNTRLLDLLRFGSGEPVGHWGGRLIWQLDESIPLTTAWLEAPQPEAREAELLEDFRSLHGRLPFANLVAGKRRVITSV
jgi:hypothetical protein